MELASIFKDIQSLVNSPLFIGAGFAIGTAGGVAYIGLKFFGEYQGLNNTQTSAKNKALLAMVNTPGAVADDIQTVLRWAHILPRNQSQ